MKELLFDWGILALIWGGAFMLVAIGIKILKGD